MGDSLVFSFINFHLVLFFVWHFEIKFKLVEFKSIVINPPSNLPEADRNLLFSKSVKTKVYRLVYFT